MDENKSAVPASEHQELDRLQSEVKHAEEVLRLAREREQQAVRDASLALRKASGAAITAGAERDHQWECGTLVLVDLAGAEYSNLDGKLGGVRARTAQETSEGREINSSLLSLKECMRALSRGAAHVPFETAN